MHTTITPDVPMPGPKRVSKVKNAFSFKGLPRLSRSAETFLREHPTQASKLVAAVLEAAAAGQAQKPVRPRVSDNLKRFVVVRESESEKLSISEAADRLKISRTTAYDWIEKGRMIGWKTTKAGVVIPAEQIAGAGELVPGISEVLRIVPDPRVAWRFLSEVSSFFDDPARPIDKLKTGLTKDVIQAAESYGEGFA